MDCTLHTRKGLTQIVGNVCCPILSNSTLQCYCGIDMALVWPSEQYIEKKQTELETESK